MKNTFAILCILAVGGCTHDKGDPPEPPPVIDPCDTLPYAYTSNIKPIIDLNCAVPTCHVTGFAYGDYSDYAGLKSKVDLGLIEARVIIGNPSFMPPAGPLSDEDIAKLTCWIEDGAPEN